MHQNLFAIKLVLVFLLTLIICEGKRFQKNDEDFILAKYPGLFKTEEEINILRAKSIAAAAQKRHSRIFTPGRCPMDQFRGMQSLISLGGSVNTNVNTYDFAASLSKPWTTLYHGCCASNRTFESFNQMINQNGQTVTIVQFKNYKQVIEMDTCITSPACTMDCKCVKEDRFFTALIKNPDYKVNVNKKYIFQVVQTPAICRCLNNAASAAKRDEF